MRHFEPKETIKSKVEYEIYTEARKVVNAKPTPIKGAIQKNRMCSQGAENEKTRESVKLSME